METGFEAWISGVVQGVNDTLSKKGGIFGRSHLGEKWNSMTIETIEGGSLRPLFYLHFLKKSFEKKPMCISYFAR